MSVRSRLQSPFGERHRTGRRDDRIVVRGTVVEAGPQLRARQALRSAERLSRVVVDGLEEGVVVFGDDRRPVSWNASALRILQLDAAGGDPWATVRLDRLQRRDGGSLSLEDNPVEAALRDRESRSEMLRLTGGPDGDRWVTVLVQPLDRADGGCVCTLQDVTASVTAEQRLREERDRAEHYLEVASTLVVVLDFHGRVERINRQGCELLGFGEGELVGRDWFDMVIPGKERLAARSAFTRLVSEIDPAGETVETFVRTKDGEQRKVAWRNAVVRDATGRVVSVLRSGEDVTDRRRAEARVAYLAFHDPLTGLANRAQLERRLEEEVARCRRGDLGLALLYLDLDDFKLVNDSLGHAAGDAVLREAARRVGAEVRRGDVLARQGGDEFLLLLVCAPGEDAQACAEQAGERILQALDTPLTVDDTRFHVGASIGVALLGDDAHDAETLLRNADAAMYLAKRAGGRSVAFWAAPTDDSRRRLSLGTRLRSAIARDELVLHYQPICGVEDPLTPVGYEALVRWQDPEEGLIPPDQFIPAAEQSGLIEAVGAWVVDALCKQAAAWAATGHHPQLSFNVSPRELSRQGLVADITATITGHGLRPGQFCAELTETAIISDARRGSSVLAELSAAGLTVAIDDFGIGHSSLHRLQELPVDTLKVDRAFVRRVPEHPGSVAVVAAVLQLAGALGMTAVVEGIERPDQLHVLRGQGTVLAQGYLLGRPVPAEALPVSGVAA